MTKVRIALPFNSVGVEDNSRDLLFISNQHGISRKTPPVPFVIPSEAEGSAVPLHQQAMQTV
jgi:hypothetical protein